MMENEFVLRPLDDTLDSVDIECFFAEGNDRSDRDKRSCQEKQANTKHRNDEGIEDESSPTMVSPDTGDAKGGKIPNGQREERTEEMIPLATEGRNEVENEVRNENPSEFTISQCITRCYPKFSTPSQVLHTCAEKRTTKILNGQFIAGYVIDSSGSLDQKRYELPKSGRNTNSRPTKKQKVVATGYHSLLIADESSILKIWSSYNGASSSEQIKSVRRLAAMPESALVCIAIESGPLEIRTTLEKYKKYVEANKEIKVHLVKTKVLSLQEQPVTLPTFTPSRNDAFSADTWMEVDTIVESQDSFEINGTFAVVDLEGRHDPFLSSSGAKYLRGTMQDPTGNTRKFTVWGQIDRFLAALPEDVEGDPKVIAFQRLRIKTLNHSSHGSSLRCPSVTNNTCFQVQDTPFTDFYSEAEKHFFSSEDLDGFE